MKELWNDCLTLAWYRLNWVVQQPIWFFAGYFIPFDAWLDKLEEKQL